MYTIVNLDRPFSCHRCATSFSRQDALSRHEYTCFGSRSLYSSISLSAHTAAVKNSTSNSSDTFSSSFQTKTKPQYKKQSIHSSDSGVYSE
ncbi:hypothetical protein HMI55_003336 [Coelomomyces lativittatus]|nr:hypothetical protein HMI55_003336 [Coelomomyces lativittatus]KAJ1504238.1 hypothetical protein HMI56_001727 [Coelomomyces lativittatus]